MIFKVYGMGQIWMKKSLNLKTFFNIRLNKTETNLYLSFFLYSLIPSIWILVRTIIITKYMKVSLDTYAQWEYLNIMLEVFQEAFVFPLFFFIGKIKNKAINDLNKIRQIYLFVFLIFLIIIFVISFFTSNLIKIIDGYNYYDQIIFFNLQLYSKIPEILLLVSTVFLLNIGKSKWFFFLLLVKMMIYIILDFTLGNENVFLNSYVGLGLSTILTNIFLFGVSLIIIANFFDYKNFWNFRTFRLTKLEFNKVFFLNFIFTFLSSVLNNFFYLLLIAKTMNSFTISGSYWLANQIIWNWILLPIIALVEVFRAITTLDVDNGVNKKELNIKFMKYFKLASLLFVISASIFSGLWIPFAGFLTNYDQVKMRESMQIRAIIIWFYLFYIWANFFEAFFIGIGKLKLLLVKSLIVNLIVYLIPFILITINLLSIKIELIIFIYGFSLLGSFIVNFVMYLILINKKHNTILNIT